MKIVILGKNTKRRREREMGREPKLERVAKMLLHLRYLLPFALFTIAFDLVTVASGKS